MPVTLTINDQPVQVSEDASVLDAINASGVYISQLCKDPDMKPIGACRTCLVQIEGQRGLPTACSTPVSEGMKVWTDTPEARRIRAGVLELTLGMVSGAGSLPSQPVRSVTTTYPYCGVGCGIKLQVNSQGRIQEALDNPENPSSVGMLCVKGRFGYTYVHHPDRLTTPLIKENGQFRPAGWDEALELIADRLPQYRGGAFGTLCSAKATNEDGYVQQKFARLVMQTNNIDQCTRLCHSPSVEAMLASLGSGATSNSYTDYEDAGCLLVIGCDPTSNHPVAASRMRRAVVERGAKLIVVNPRRIDMCDYADLWLRPYPGTDVALLNGMAQVALEEGLADGDFIRDRTDGFEEWAEVVRQYTPDRVADITGVPAPDIRQAARLYAQPPLPSRPPWGRAPASAVPASSGAWA